MHLINNSLARALTLPLVLLVIMITSCTPEGIKPNDPPPPPVTPGAPYLNASLTRDTAWFKGSDTCNFSSDGVVKYNGSSEVFNPIIFTNITEKIGIELTATKTVNGVVSPTTTKNLTVQVYSENKTNICKDVIWRRDSTMQSNILFSVNEVPTLYSRIIGAMDDGWMYQFFTGNTYKLIIPSGPATGSYYPRYFYFSSTDTKITIDNTTLDIESSGPTRLIISIVTQVGFTTNQWVKQLICFSKV